MILWTIIAFYSLCFVGLLVLPSRSKVHTYCISCLIGIDQAFNAILLGDPDETISSRAGKGRRRGSKGWTILANILDFIDPNHSESSIEWDEGTTTKEAPLIARHKQSKDKETS